VCEIGTNQVSLSILCLEHFFEVFSIHSLLSRACGVLQNTLNFSQNTVLL